MIVFCERFYFDWTAPIVPVPKRDGKFRICEDYKVTFNPQLYIEQYPLPKPQDLFVFLAGGQKFTKLNLQQACLQLQLEELILVFSNILGCPLELPRPLPYIVFQRVKDTILQGLDGVICYFDNILVTGPSDGVHLLNFDKVLERLQQHGFRHKQSKCSFLQSSVTYLGYQIDARGLHHLLTSLMQW